MTELDALKIREEVLQAMYWMRSEGFGDSPTPAELARFLAVPKETLAVYLARFADEGYLVQVEVGYSLTERGSELGKRSFAEEFADLTRQAHGECDDDCWCHESPEEAARCLEERLERAR
jgi:DNA-binding IclR family transcriptional regulator